MCVKPSSLCVVVLLALLIRGGFLLLTPDALESDPDGYRRLAENLFEHGTFGAADVPTAYRPPLYPLLLTGCVAFDRDSHIAIGVLHIILGVATVALVWMLGCWWGLGRCGAVLAALLVACDPILLNQSTQVMTETPAAFLVVAGLVLLTWVYQYPTVSRAMLTGIVLALGALCRPALLLWAIGVGVIGILHGRRLATCSGPEENTAGKPARYTLLTVFAIGVLMVLCPWAIRNQFQFGRPIVTTTHGGYTLLLANNPDFYQWLRTAPWGDLWRADRFNAEWEQHKPHDPLQADRLAYAEAWRTIRRQPGTFVYACLVRFGRFWSPLPHRLSSEETLSRRLSRYTVAVWYLCEYLLVAIGLGWEWKTKGGGRKRDWGLGIGTSALLLLACLTAVHMVYWTDMRMRAPLMPVVALAVIAAVQRIWHETR